MLVCEECGAVGDGGAQGWQAHVAYDPREDDASFVVIFCPTCAEREFGDRSIESR